MDQFSNDKHHMFNWSAKLEHSDNFTLDRLSRSIHCCTAGNQSLILSLHLERPMLSKIFLLPSNIFPWLGSVTYCTAYGKPTDRPSVWLPLEVFNNHKHTYRNTECAVAIWDLLHNDHMVIATRELMYSTCQQHYGRHKALGLVLLLLSCITLCVRVCDIYNTMQILRRTLPNRMKL